MKVNSYVASAKRHINATESIDSAGNIFNAASYIALGMGVGLSPFKSNPSFWIFINTVLMISFIPTMNCVIPEEFEVFLVKYFGVAKVSIPFEYLPSWIPNPLLLLDKFKTKPFNQKFQEAGYDSLSMIYNCASQLITWIIVLFTYLSFVIFSKILPQSL